jgi:hypothetical protein
MTAAKPRRSDEVDTKLLPDGYIVLYNIKTEWGHTLTPLGAVVWELCDGTLSVEEIVHHVGELTERSGDAELGAQVVKLVDEFVTLGLVHTESASAEVT